MMHLNAFNMKRKSFTIILFFFIHFSAISQSPSWAWAKNSGGINSDGGKSVCTDLNGNIYVTGYYAGPIAFGTATLNSIGTINVFIAKYDKSGNVLWAKN